MNDEALKNTFQELRERDSRSTPNLSRMLPAREALVRDQIGGLIWRFAAGAIGIASLALFLAWPGNPDVTGAMIELERAEGLLLASWEAPSDSLLEPPVTEFDLQFLIAKN